MHHLEQWAWMHGRWAVAVSDDMSKSSDFCQILTKASDLLAQLDKFAAQLRQRQGFPVPQNFRQDVTDLLPRFTTVRAQYVATLVKAGLDMSELQLLHPDFETLGRVYAHDLASLPGFLKSVDDQIVTQSAIHSDLTMKEDYYSRALRSGVYLQTSRWCCPDGPEPAGCQ
jgi:hypothetical protein